jgi:hypothetical protein
MTVNSLTAWREETRPRDHPRDGVSMDVQVQTTNWKSLYNGYRET